MGKVDLKLDWCSYEAAKYAVMHWHYSKCMPAGKTTKVGIWEADEFIGVVVFSRGANQNLLKPYGLKQIGGCELTRIALKTGHVSPVSKIISISLKFLKLHSPGLRLVVSYADTGQGHHGGIYQATNWVYEGLFSGECSVVVNGKLMHRRSAYSRYGTTRPKGSVNVPAPGKHKYLMPLDKEMRKQIELLRKPYPKRPADGSNLATS
ncbi:protein Mom [Candidatus Pacearchaeota archaeon]|nr:protein Mom [Candidatus Pacearchaeota archaeon]